MPTIIITAAPAYPVTAAEFCTWARIGSAEQSAEADVIDLLIQSVTALADRKKK